MAKEIVVSGIKFEVGKEYNHKLGIVKVLKINPVVKKMNVQLGETIRELDILIFARMLQNQAIEEQKKASGIKEQNKKEDYFFTLGIIAAKGTLSAEMGYTYYNTFIKRYYSITGQCENVPFVFRCAPETKKPGSELRIEIENEITKNERFCLPENVRPVTDKYGKTTINKNDFWWDLVEKLGFSTGRNQNIERILNNIPEKYREHFKAGYEQFKK